MRRGSAYRDVSSVGNMRSLIAAVLPANVVTTHTVFCLRTPVSLEASHFLCGILNSFVMNLVVRMLMGGHVTTSLAEQLPVPVWNVARQPTADCTTGATAGRWQSTRPSSKARLEAEVATLYGSTSRSSSGSWMAFRWFRANSGNGGGGAQEGSCGM